MTHPLCTRLWVGPKPSPRSNVGRASRPPEGDRWVPPPGKDRPGAVRRPHATLPHQTDVDAPRQPEDCGECQRHAEVDVPSSQAPIRFADSGELPTIQPKPDRFPSAHRQLVSSDERPASPGHRVAPPRRPVRTEVRTVGCLGAVARVPTASRRRRSWAGLSKDPVPRHGFPHPLRSACAVSNDLGGLLLSAPSGVFQPVTLVEFAVRKSSTW